MGEKEIDNSHRSKTSSHHNTVKCFYQQDRIDGCYYGFEKKGHNSRTIIQQLFLITSIYAVGKCVEIGYGRLVIEHIEKKGSFV